MAFANTQSGQLIIDVDDKTRNVVGVDMDSVFHVTDSIANTASDSCTPQIVPGITFQTVNGKAVVVASLQYMHTFSVTKNTRSDWKIHMKGRILFSWLMYVFSGCLPR